jgi:DNA transformation protein and related proteins
LKSIGMGLALSIMSQALVDHCLELLAPLGAVRAKRMFGGHGLYVDELFVAIIAFERLYLKADAQTQPAFAAAGCESFVYDGKGKPITMNYWTVPAEAMESPALMQPWARQAIDAALRARAAKPAAPRSKTRAAASKPKATASRTRR